MSSLDAENEGANDGELLVFHDVDGCLNAPDGTPLALAGHEFTDAEARRLRQFGAVLDGSAARQLVLNTGRSWEATRFICDAINSNKIQYALVEHGAELWDVTKNKPVPFGNTTVSVIPALSQALASRAAIAGLIDWFESEGAFRLAAAVDYSERLPYARDKSWNLTFSVPDALDGDEVFNNLKALIRREPQFQQAGFVYHYSRWNRFIDVMGTMDKGLGMIATLAHLRMDSPRVAAIGDGLNDLSMLKRATIPVCPANAEAQVIELCQSSGYASKHHFIDGTTDWLAQL